MKKVLILTFVMILMALCSVNILASEYNYYATLDFITSGNISYGLWSTLSSHRNESSISIYWEVQVSKTVSSSWSLDPTECNLLGISKSSSTTTYHYEDDYVPPRSVSYLKKRTNHRSDAYVYTHWREWIDNYGFLRKQMVYQEDVFKTYSWDDYTFTHSYI